MYSNKYQNQMTYVPPNNNMQQMPFQQQYANPHMQNFMQTQFQPHPMINPIFLNNNTPQTNQSHVSLRDMPRTSLTKTFIFDDNKGSNKINIVFEVTTGNKYNVVAPVTMMLKDLLRKFLEKLHVPISLLGKEIFFIFNADKISPNEEKTINQMHINDSSKIMVIDTHNLIGAKNK